MYELMRRIGINLSRNARDPTPNKGAFNKRFFARGLDVGPLFLQMTIK